MRKVKPQLWGARDPNKETEERKERGGEGAPTPQPKRPEPGKKNRAPARERERGRRRRQRRRGRKRARTGRERRRERGRGQREEEGGERREERREPGRAGGRRRGGGGNRGRSHPAPSRYSVTHNGLLGARQPQRLPSVSVNQAEPAGCAEPAGARRDLSRICRTRGVGTTRPRLGAANARPYPGTKVTPAAEEHTVRGAQGAQTAPSRVQC